MTTTLSSKGQVVLPRSARQRLGLRPGVKFDCRVEGNDIVLTPQGIVGAKSRLVRDKTTGMIVTEAQEGTEVVTSERIQALLAVPNWDLCE
jgi:AbrB family looped-hinge helix DNA binding protein